MAPETTYESDTYRRFYFGGGFHFAVGIDLAEPAWAIDLPHQCGAWRVTEGRASRSQAIAAMTQFVEEAQEVLTWLKAQT